ncbi:alpha/beta fold hydrolase [Micromonospora sp. NBC_01813]|uniref:alpha/beta fold hydrolase n=1 Tax=Micromonospora sp. NBC_01813 TaxID=2975988 RepID=UPI002DDC11E2|nr:alpha/beta hydrolase family protein [Micromonospora sp. NBC_01813]WSA06657.1 alpha/beta fold hydrolase [Micromonospora sp. NBC_01813]
MTLLADEHGSTNSPSVVLLHGLSTTSWMWGRQAAALAEDLHVLVPDLPGHGRSNHRSWRSLDDTVDAVADLIATRTATGRAHVVGLSLGGYVATRLAADRPEIIDTAIVSGVNVLPFPHPGRMRLLNLIMAPVATSGPVLRANAKALGVPAGDFDGYRAAARSMSARTFRRVGAEVTTFGVPVAAATSPCRLLAVAGATEHELILRSLPVLADAFRSGTARIAAGVGHAWNGQAPELFVDMVRAHIAGTPLPGQLQAIRAVTP